MDVADLRSCEYFFLPVNSLCTTSTTTTVISTTTTSSTTSTTSTTTSTTSTTTSTTSTTTSTTSTTTTVPATTTTTTTISPEIYGLLYNWFAASDSRIAEAGWRVPTATEWYNLGLALGGSPHFPSVYGVSHKLKTIGNETDGTGLWKKSSIIGAEGTNSSGMSVNPSGIVHEDGSPGSRTTDANFWCVDEQSSTLGKYFNISYLNQTLYRSAVNYLKNYGFSIRLIKDAGTPWSPGDTYTDYDGNVYPTALMADGKVWLVESLRTQHYNDGVLIPTNPIDWSTRITGALHTYEP